MATVYERSLAFPGQIAMTERVITYIDGFNLYFGLREAKLDRFRWLNVEALALNLLKSHQQLIAVKYFTAMVKGPDRKKVQRQKSYTDALAVQPNLHIVWGRYVKRHNSKCLKCGRSSTRWEEKMTDVNIAAHLSSDAHTNRLDKALLITGDSDLAAAVDLIRSETGKKVIVIFPPKRKSVDLEAVADASFELNRGKIARSLLPNPVRLPDGSEVTCPESWR